MPVLFSQNDYTVTVCDPPYANYQWNSDLSIYEEFPDIQTYITEGVFVEPARKEQIIKNNHRNFFCFSLMKTMPTCLQTTLYSSGSYNQAPAISDGAYSAQQAASSLSAAEGIDTLFMNSYNVLANLPQITEVSNEVPSSFLLMMNNLTHEPMLLEAPAYTPAQIVDNTQYDAAHADRFTVDGVTLQVNTVKHMGHYHANAAAFVLLGNWFDYLRECGVYDNTRIILVSDHGHDIYQLDELLLDSGNGASHDMESYFPLLMVKDFGSQGFTISDEFMTNADVPTLATAGLIENPTNPFTGKFISSDEKTAHEQYVILSREWDVEVNNGNTFLPSQWASVKDDLWNADNWTFYEGETVLKGHSFP